MARRMATVLLVGAAAAGAFLLSHISRAPSAHQADDQEEQCQAIEESGEEESGSSSPTALPKLSRLRAVEHARETPPTRTLDSVRQSP